MIGAFWFICELCVSNERVNSLDHISFRFFRQKHFPICQTKCHSKQQKKMSIIYINYISQYSIHTVRVQYTPYTCSTTIYIYILPLNIRMCVEYAMHVLLF